MAHRAMHHQCRHLFQGTTEDTMARNGHAVGCPEGEVPPASLRQACFPGRGHAASQGPGRWWEALSGCATV
eukprot:4591873-Lingulodinium_polyedra.AAC.1